MIVDTSSKKMVNDFLNKQTNLDILKFITCGSVDDGKSTLIGRLLYEADSILDDQLNSLKSESKFSKRPKSIHVFKMYHIATPNVIDMNSTWKHISIDPLFLFN